MAIGAGAGIVGMNEWHCRIKELIEFFIENPIVFLFTLRKAENSLFIHFRHISLAIT